MLHRILFAAILLLGLVPAGAQTTTPAKYQLLWEVTAPHLARPSYLYGTMHVTDSRVFDMPDSVLLAIQNTSGFALEVDFDLASYRVLEYMYATHGEAMLDEETWTTNTRSWDGNAAKRDPNDVFKLFDRQAESTEATFLDAFLYRLARKQGKVITGLENILDQLAMLTEPQAEAPAKPDSTGKVPAKRLRLNEMIEIYQTGDLDALDRLVNEGATSSYFKNEVIIRRNHGMAQRSDSLMHIRPTFIGVGAAHLPGKEGVISLLRAKGYHLRPVAATYSGLNKVAREEVYQPQWSTFAREGDGYRIKVPTKPFPINIIDGKLKMYLGMDFPGGIVYCFYAMPMPVEVTDDKMDVVGRALIKSFGSHNVNSDKTKSITHQSLLGREYVVKKSGESMRIRVLFGNGKMYMLLLGNSEQVLFSPAAEDWFASLEVFEPLAMTKQTAWPVVDKLNGFSLDFPGEPDYVSDNVSTFTHGGSGTPFNVYEAKSSSHRQRLVMLTEDFEDWYAIGKLASRMPDCIRYYSGADLKPESEFKRVVTDGVEGLEGSYLGTSGLKYRIRCHLRLNRLYLLALSMPQDDPDSAVVDKVMGSLHFLPVPAAKLKQPQEVPGVYAATFPGKPRHILRKTVPSPLIGDIDSMDTDLHHDATTSLNTSVSWGPVWKYYSGTDAGLLRDIRKTAEIDSGTVVLDTTMLLAGFNGRKLVIQSFDGSMHDHRQWIVAGDLLLEARIQTIADANGQSTAEQFFRQFRPLAHVDGPRQDRHVAPKLQQLLQETDTADGGEFMRMMNLSHYKLQPAEFAIAIDSLKAHNDSIPFNTDDGILQMLLDCDDATLLAPLQDLYAWYPADDEKRMEIVERLLRRDEWPGAAEWALARLHDEPSPLVAAGNRFGWNGYLEGDSTLERLKRIDFLLDDPRFALRLAAAMASQALLAAQDYKDYGGKLLQILSQAIDRYAPYEASAWRIQYEMDQLIRYLMELDQAGWPAQAKRLFYVPDSYLPGTVYVTMRDLGLEPTGKETKLVFESRYSRMEALTWVLENGVADKIPGKYRKLDFIAEVSLEIAIDDYPTRVELVERREIRFQDEQQWLYIYRFALEGDQDWTLGFAGPFPLKGYPESTYLPLSGSNWEEFHPNSYLRKAKAWVKEIESQED